MHKHLHSALCPAVRWVSCRIDLNDECFLPHASVLSSSSLSSTSSEATFHICLELICHIRAAFVFYQLSVNCFCRAIISEQERNQSLNEGNQTADKLHKSTSQQQLSKKNHVRTYCKQCRDINIQKPVSSKGALDEEDGFV